MLLVQKKRIALFLAYRNAFWDVTVFHTSPDGSSQTILVSSLPHSKILKLLHVNHPYVWHSVLLT